MKRRAGSRWIFAAMALLLWGLAAWITATRTFTVHGRHLTSYAVETTGSEALWWAASIASMGTAMLAAFASTARAQAWWMGAWLTAAVLLPLIPSYTGVK